MEADGLYVDAVSGIVPALLIVVFFGILRQVFIALFHVDSLQALLESVVDVLLGWIEQTQKRKIEQNAYHQAYRL